MLKALEEIDVIQASMLRALASSHRLRIIHMLGEGPLEVNELARKLDVAQSAASQHLSSMRNVGLVEAVRDGRSVHYRLADPDVLIACDAMRAVIVRRLSALGSIAAAAKRNDLDERNQGVALGADHRTGSLMLARQHDHGSTR